jgi:hypothetical protein
MVWREDDKLDRLPFCGWRSCRKTTCSPTSGLEVLLLCELISNSFWSCEQTFQHELYITPEPRQTLGISKCSSC